MFLKEYSGKAAPFFVGGEKKQVDYMTRVDPLSGNVSKISVERAQRGIGISVAIQMEPVENCVFCDYQKHTPGERVEHACGAVSVPNRYPWEKYDWVTIYPPFDQHKLFLTDIYFEDLERMTESAYDLAIICSRDPEVISFMDFTNWGVFAGASQQHPHSQHKSITGVPSPVISNEMEHCRRIFEKTGKNPFQILEREERAIGRRVIHDNEVFISSMFAPLCPNEVLVFPKEDIANIIQTSGFDRRKIIEPILGIFPALFFYLGISNMNIAVHMAPFAQMEEARKYYRWHMHIYPRRSRLPADRAGAEIGFGTEVIDVMPEVTADLLRCWYNDGPVEDLLCRTMEDSPVPGLQGHFTSFVKTNGHLHRPNAPSG